MCQSTSFQIIVHNLESQRPQYGLVESARELGFGAAEATGEDIGRTGSAQAERPGFQRLCDSFAPVRWKRVIAPERHRIWISIIPAG